MISIRNLSFQYNSKATIAFPDFTIPRGQHCLLLGESGSGKTTLLHLLGGLLRGYEGSVQVDNTELSTLSEKALDKFRGQHVGFIFQKNHLINAFTVEKNILLSPFLAGLNPDLERFNTILSSLGLAEKKQSPVSALSHGQAQRVAIARAVINHPSIIFADEPTSALDDSNCNRVIDLLLQVAKAQDTTLVVATHDQRLKDKIKNQIVLSSPLKR
ncbi:ABC transporter ATP-binding protein [Pseudochryseolinea flava]|uniref:ABC transporter ATP-binding protein n=1 Tax=Pseudochryseolinea flava TaxID=2059302 RepID=A0A364Y667_9BACT|nr:ATP-binding cassette domain-containing protein [Pseudochryseolinea flava]RAW01851.1 ABC transporter ATP-binding protein [Pseudochryseolinea flava]